MKLTWMEKYLDHAESMILDDRIDEGLALLDNLLYESQGMEVCTTTWMGLPLLF